MEDTKIPAASVVYPIGESNTSCGYCGQSDSSVSYGMHAEVLSVDAYQTLLDRGWRRSGKWLYRPNLRHTCCQLQTIRLEVARFEASGSQRRVLKKWQKYLKGGRTDGMGMVADAGTAVAAEGTEERTAERKSVAGSEDAFSDGTDRLSVDMVDICEDDEEYEEHDGDLEPKRPRSPQEDGLEEEEGFKEFEELLFSDSSKVMTTPKGKRQEVVGGCDLTGKRQRSHLCLASLANGDKVEGAELSPSVVFKEKLRVDSVDCEWNKEKKVEKLDVKEIVTSALATAIEDAKAAREIPDDVSYPDVFLKQANEHLRKAHGSNIVFSSNIAFAIVGKAKSAKIRSVGVATNELLTPVAVATCLLRRAVAVMGSISGNAARLVSLRQVNGHLNVFCEVASAMECMEKNGTRNRERGDRQIKSSPAPSSVPPSATTKSFRVVTLPSSHPDIPDVEFELFKKYQTLHHNDMGVSVRSFKRFLCDSPLVPVSREECPTAPTCGYGSFHQQYWVGDRLIAVGVVDVLPRCLSSKYFFWDPEMAKLSLGTLASLLEIDWVKSQAELAPEFRHYYLGYYLHDCHRMRYKASFSPSDLLNPLTYAWEPIAKIADDLDAGKAPWNLRGAAGEMVMESDTGRDRDDLDALDDVDDIKLAITCPNSQRRAWKVMPFGVVRQLGLIRAGAADELVQAIKEFRRMVGPKCASSMMYAV